MSNEKITSVSNSNSAENHESIINIYVVYRLIPEINLGGIGHTLQNCLFGAVKLTKNADIDKYKYSGYGIGFDSRGTFSHPSGGYDRSVIILAADLSKSTHSNNKTKIILVLGNDFMQRIDSTTIYTEKM